MPEQGGTTRNGKPKKSHGGRRRKEDFPDAADAYEGLYRRLMMEENVTKHMLQTCFSDKELRVVMGMNKILINDYIQEQGRYKEKPKSAKVDVLLPYVLNKTLITPSALHASFERFDFQQKKFGSRRDGYNNGNTAMVGAPTSGFMNMRPGGSYGYDEQAQQQQQLGAALQALQQQQAAAAAAAAAAVASQGNYVNTMSGAQGFPHNAMTGSSLFPQAQGAAGSLFSAATTCDSAAAAAYSPTSMAQQQQAMVQQMHQQLQQIMQHGGSAAAAAAAAAVAAAAAGQQQLQQQQAQQPADAGQRILFGEWCAYQHTVIYDNLPDLFLAFDLYAQSLNNGAGGFISAKR